MGNIHDEARAGADAAKSREDAAKQPWFKPHQASVSRFLDEEPPTRQYLLKKVLPLGVVGSIIAPGGLGKSQLSLQLAASVASGEPLCGAWEVSTTGQALCLMAEEDTPELHRRTFDVVNALPEPARKLCRENLFVMSVSGTVNLLTERYTQSSDATRTERYEQLRATIRQFHNLRLVIIDPASRFRGGDENSTSDVSRFVEAIELLARESRATVLVLHHTKKGGSSSDADQENSRGASAFTDGIRFVMELKRMDSKDAAKFAIPPDDEGLYLSTHVVKNNYGRSHSAELWLKRGENGVLARVELLQQKQRTEIERRFEILSVLLAESARGQLYTLTDFCRKFSGEKGPFGIGRAKLTRDVDALLKGGQLVQRPPTTKERRSLHKNARKILTVGTQEDLGAPS